ncbi:MAG: T9SS type A sorting domain-containing protein [Saprospiraceae bacterium]|nr:T9SS type A sorting domain-containing protein [Saprospiraceae bacterium]
MVQTQGPLPGSVVDITCPPTPITIAYKATDGAGNMSTCSYQVMVIDTEKPEFDADILMPGNVTVECDAVPTNCIPRTGGNCAPLTVSDVNDNCAGPLTVAFNEVSTQDPNPANCGHYNYMITRTWTITDCADNALIAAGLPPTHQLIHVQVVTVRDTKAPTALCKNGTVQLDKTGSFILNPLNVDNGSFDNCAAFPYLTFSITPNQFSCADLGTNLVTLSVTDPCGNVGTCTAIITVEEGIAPCTPQLDVETLCMGMGNMGNATTLDNGQFQDIITVKALAMQTWSITINNGGLYSITSPAPPASPILLPVGTVFTAGTADGIDNDGDGSTDEADEMIYYTLRAVHVDCQGYDITVSNAGAIGMGLSATTTRIQNKACYPNPYFSNLLENFYCLGTPPFQILVGEYNNAAGAVVPGSMMIDGIPANIFDASSLGLGAHTVMATFDAGTATQNLIIDGVQIGGSMQDAVNDPGCKQKITKVINIVETPNTLVCNDLVYVSMDDDCKVTVGADDVLEGNYFCYGDYIVEVDKTLPYGNGPWVLAIFDASDIGKTYQYRVLHISGGSNLCSGEIKIEDKLAPKLVCPIDITIACSESTEVSNTGNVGIADCSSYTTVIDDVFTDFGQCSSPRGQILRNWIVTDIWGNQAACSQTITITPFDFAEVDFPLDVTLNCEVAYLNSNAIQPDNTGRPSINGFPIGVGGFCTASINYTDERFDICPGSYEILRTWKIRNTCLPIGPDNPIEHVQIITLSDLGGPEFVCPPAVTVSSDPFTCCATAALPGMIVSEGCSNIIELEAKVTGVDPNNGNIITFTVGGYLSDFPGNNWWNPDTLAVFSYTQCMPLGDYTIQYKAQDQCSNISYCSFVLTVADLVPPSVACDHFTQVALTTGGVALINASTFDDGSTDNCCMDYFEVRRMNANLCEDDQFDSTVKFCCSDIGDTILVVFRAWDCHDNYNDCMVSVLVEDKIKPACQSPAQVLVNCENFDPSLWSYGKADVSDNCCLDTNRVYLGQIGLAHTVNYSLFDTVCNKGTITRTFRAFDCANNSSQCTQRVIVTYLQDYFVKFPNDVIVTVCDGTGLYGEPGFFGEDCELLGVSYADEVFTVVPDACFKIERTWSIINWCTFNPNLDFVYVPNPNPNPQVNNPGNLPGPIVSACGTLPPWAPTVAKINPSDPTATNFCTFWDANANGYRYKQIIKIIDGQAPTGTFVTPTCDNQNWLTANSNQLWNEPYWWDNGLQLHDLCEEPTDICITGTDACSGSNVNIEYLLFLDLDGDGVMETVINSVNTGIAGLGWNNVLFNNLNTPNFSGGTPRNFDERPVPANQKYGFAIQETVVGNNKTACVRWNTQQAQNTFVAPELPHGTHKIKWLISDGCGNNQEYEYSFTVKDCKAPTVVCLNGLSVNIMPTAMIQLWASDFLQYTEDNCTPAGQIKLGIRKCGQVPTSSGFPVDAQGNPITNVTFDCTELGTQCVELWSIDAAGNADYCETYVIVQDNLGNCPTADHINVTGALKTEMTEGVEEGSVHIDGTSTFAPPYSYFDLSDTVGVYAVTNSVPLAATFVIAPEKDDNPLNGVTTYDLVLISKHILGIEPLNTPYKMIAADANKSGSITTFDIVELRKLILGIYTELPNNTSWRFVDKAFQFPNLLNPFQTLFPETISVADAMASQIGEDFVGVKIGDVNNTSIANATMQAEDRTTGIALFDLEDRSVKSGETFEVTFRSAQPLKGFQFTMLLNGLEAVGAVASDNVTASNFGMVFENATTVSIDGAQEFTLRFQAEKSGTLSEMLGVSGSITRAEAYAECGKGNAECGVTRLGVAFRFGGKTIAGVGFELYQNQPNPFVNRTSIGFYLPEAAEATLSVYDETGRMVYQQKGQFAKGENSVTLDRALLNTTGKLYYKLETDTDSATKKMIQAK